MKIAAALFLLACLAACGGGDPEPDPDDCAPAAAAPGGAQQIPAAPCRLHSL